ncbi:hypothetical protein CIK05_02095 [Bdellovibrio sp. qaytius]|nr:hypothetical protein CIK05_02095 [Bdellovibrio sp. qaytius]
MKTFICALLISASAFAAVTELPKTLSKTMKAMSADLKQVATQVADPKANENSALLSDDFVAMVIHAKDFTPDTVAALPANEQPAALAEYQLMLDQTAEVGVKLAAAFRANDNALATELLNQLSQAKKDGHTKFK